MKTARACLIVMYLYIILSVAAPVVVVVSGQFHELEMLGLGLLWGYLASAVLLQILGFSAAGAGLWLCHKGEGEKLAKGWKLLKFGSVPFYLLNFMVCFLAMALLIGASRGLLVVVLPIPVTYTCLLIVQSGCLGACLVFLLRRQREQKPAVLHYVLQFLPVLDFISSLVLLKKYGHVEDEMEEEEEYSYR